MVAKTPTFSLSATVRSVPELPYEKIKNDILGKTYVVSLVFVGSKSARALNHAHRKKTYVPNVLAFPLSKNCGEIYLCPESARREAKRYGQKYESYVGQLFIHALFHLKGYDHSATMEKAEMRAQKKHGLLHS